jgi:hypothetical protein
MALLMVGDYVARPAVSGMIYTFTYDKVISQISGYKGSTGYARLGSLFWIGFISSEGAQLVRNFYYSSNGSSSGYTATATSELVAIGVGSITGMIYVGVQGKSMSLGLAWKLILASATAEIVTGWLWSYFLAGLFNGTVSL